jgi:hypothetical protein
MRGEGTVVTELKSEMEAVFFIIIARERETREQEN